MEFDESFKSKETKAESPRARQSDWIDATDSLEAVEAIKGWKNFIFAIALITLLLVQIIFWLANTGIIFTPENQQTPPAAAQINNPSLPTSIEGSNLLTTKTEPNQLPAEKHHNLKSMLTLIREVNSTSMSNFLKIINTILILSAIIYCLILLESVQIAIAGRLGGINHICRGFFLSLVLVIILLPWQKIFPGFAVGCVFSSQELLNAHSFVKTGDVLDQFVYYARFCILWGLSAYPVIKCPVSEHKMGKGHTSQARSHLSVKSKKY